MKLRVKGTQAMRADLFGLRSGMPVQLVRERDNDYDRNAVIVLRAGADWHDVRILMRQHPSVGDCLAGSGLDREEALDRVRAYAWRVPGVIGYLPRMAAQRFGPERYTATIAGVPRHNGTPGVDLNLERKQDQAVAKGSGAKTEKGAA